MKTNSMSNIWYCSGTDKNCVRKQSLLPFGSFIINPKLLSEQKTAHIEVNGKLMLISARAESGFTGSFFF